MAHHPFNMHREHQAGHRRVNHILKGEPSGAKQHSKSHAFSKVTSKTAAEDHDDSVSGTKAPKRYARGGKVKGKGGHHTNIAIVVPGAKGAAPGGLPPGGPPPMPDGGLPPPPMGAAPPPMGGPPGLPPGMPPPGMPMRARGGKVIDGESTKADIKKWGKHAKKNSYFRGGAASGVGREEKAEHMERRRGEKT